LTAFEKAWALLKIRYDEEGDPRDLPPFLQDDDETPFQYDTDKYHDQEKNEQIQHILDDIAQRNYDERQPKGTGRGDCKQCGVDLDDWYEDEPAYQAGMCDDCYIREQMEKVKRLDHYGYDGPTESGPLWKNRFKITPYGAGWRMFADSGADYNVEQLLQSGWDPEHINIVHVGEGEDTPWGYLPGAETVWVNRASPLFEDTMSSYLAGEPKGYDPFEVYE